MKKSYLLFFILLSSLHIFSQQGHAISINFKAYKNQQIYLGYYYGKLKALADSTTLDATGKGVFKGPQTLYGGIYFIVSPQKQILFELLIDKQQNFSISADTTRLPESIVFTGSPENIQFQQYSIFASNTGREIAGLNELLKQPKNTAETAKINARIKFLSTRMTNYRDSLSKKESGSFLTSLFRAMREPQVPPAAKHPGGKYDSVYAYRYFKDHYWDSVSLTDGRLVRTPFFEAKLEKYYKDLVAPQPDSIKKEVDQMLLDSRTDTEMYKYLMMYFVQKYINPEYMGQDAVFVHLFEKYVNTGRAEFFTTQYKEHMTKRAYSLMANLIGQPAADLKMVDSLDKPQNLYTVKSPFTVVCFWDPNCGHCQELVPKLDSIYQAKWKNMGVKIYAVMVEANKLNWSKYIKEHKLGDWIHVYQTSAQAEEDETAGRPGYKQLYDVYQTPILYLLDENKRIIAKKLSYNQIDEVLDLKSRTSKSN